MSSAYFDALAKATIFNENVSQAFAYESYLKTPRGTTPEKPTSQCSVCKSVWVAGLNVSVSIKYKKRKDGSRKRVLRYKCSFCHKSAYFDSLIQKKPTVDEILNTIKVPVASSTNRKKKKNKPKIPIVKKEPKKSLSLMDFMSS